MHKQSSSCSRASSAFIKGTVTYTSCVDSVEVFVTRIKSTNQWYTCKNAWLQDQLSNHGKYKAIKHNFCQFWLQTFQQATCETLPCVIAAQGMFSLKISDVSQNFQMYVNFLLHRPLLHNVLMYSHHIGYRGSLEYIFACTALLKISALKTHTIFLSHFITFFANC